MAIEELLAVVAPPKEPLEVGDERAWERIEERIGLPLPSDYRDLLMHYGSGTFIDPRRIRMTAYNFFSEVHLSYVERTLDFHRAEDDYLEHDVRYHPDTPGLVMWGEDVNGALLFWLAEGAPDHWPVVVQPPRYYEVETLDMSATTFLAKSFRHDLSCLIWNGLPFTEPGAARFEPRIIRNFGG